MNLEANLRNNVPKLHRPCNLGSRHGDSQSNEAQRRKELLLLPSCLVNVVCCIAWQLEGLRIALAQPRSVRRVGVR